MAAPRSKLIATLIVGSVVLFGLLTVAYYWRYLKRDELRAWDTLQVEFGDVSGLRTKDPVRLDGATIGRVKAIQSVKRGRDEIALVTLELEPNLVLHADARVKIVSRNSLGRVAVEMDPGVAKELLDRSKPQSGRSLPPSTDLSQVSRRKEIKRQVEQFELQTREATHPDGNAVGEILFNVDRYQQTRAGLAKLRKTWQGIDAGLAAFERRQVKEGMLSRESYLLAAETLSNFRETLTQMRTGWREIERGGGVGGRILQDKATAENTRLIVNAARDQTERTLRHEGTLGRLVDPNQNYLAPMEKTVSDLEVVTNKGDEGQGFMGTLSSPAVGGSVRESMRGIEATFRRLRDAQDGDTARKDVEDALGNFDDFLIKARRGLSGLRSGLPDKTFQGAVFGVF